MGTNGICRKMSGKTVAEFRKTARQLFGGKHDTLAALVSKRMVKIEGYRAVGNRDYDTLHEIVEEMQPMTVRQIFYQATVQNIVEKTEKGYSKVQRASVHMRRENLLPWKWIIDNTRGRRSALYPR